MSPGNSLKITVITVTYNCANVLQSTIDSVVGQSYHDVEYIIVDGASTDGTLDIIKANADKITRWVSEPDSGIYDAMNKGIAMATGDYINFMNAGDTFYEATVIATIFIKATPDIDIIYGNLLVSKNNNIYLIKPHCLSLITEKMVFGHPATFVNKQLLVDTPFDTSFRIASDYNFFYKAYKNGKKFQYVNVDVAIFEGEDGISSTNIKQVTYENARVKGLTSSLGWQVKFGLNCIVIGVKSAAKRWLPQKLVFHIKHRNMKKLED